MISRSLKSKIFAFVLILLLASTYIFADERVKGSITSQGSVTVNGTAIASGSTVLSPSIISSKDGSNAVINIGTLGQLFIDSKTEVKLAFSDSGVKIELMSGSLRVQKSNPSSNVEVSANTCNQIEVMSGEVSVWEQGKGNSNEPKSILNTGQIKEWKNKSATYSISRSSNLDYKVSIIDCNAAVAKAPTSHLRAIGILAGAAGAGAGIAVPLLGGNDNTVSTSRP